MFIRRKKNRAGGISIVIIDKGNGKLMDRHKFEYFRVGHK